MRIDPKGMVGQYPALLVRQALRQLRNQFQWGLSELEEAAALPPGSGSALAKVLQSQGLIQTAGRGAWTLTQAGQTFSSATAAKPVTRATAEKALSEFLDRVARVNEDPYFLAKVTKVVLFGSMLKPEVERLSDVDVAIELTRKEADLDRASLQNRQRAEELAAGGKRFRNIVEVEFCWHLETFKFLKGGSRVIALADFKVEGSFVMAVPHRVLLGDPEQMAVAPPPAPKPATRKRRPRGCPF
jgi:predicted nucleotidyltransferase